MGKIFSVLSGLIFLGAFSSSSHYQLQSFSVNSGGTNGATSTTYRVQATSGETTGNQTLSAGYTLNAGEISAQQSSTPPAPAVDNGSGTYYNKLHVVINNSANPSDSTFAVRVMDSCLCFQKYWQADGTIGDSPAYQTYSAWGGASGSYITGLVPSNTYYMFESAKQGQFTASPFGPAATGTTVAPALSFSVSTNLIDFGSLFVGSANTGPSFHFDFSTNAYNGGNIYLAGNNAGLYSASTGHTLQVSPPTGDLNSLAEGFGVVIYGGSSLVAQAPYNTGNPYTVATVPTTFQPILIASGPVTSDTAFGGTAIRGQSSTPAATDYTNTLTFVAAANY